MQHASLCKRHLVFLQAWVGHPYYDVIDNSTDFERKVMRMISVSYVYLVRTESSSQRNFAVARMLCCV